MAKPICPLIGAPCRGKGCIMFAEGGFDDAPNGRCRLVNVDDEASRHRYWIRPADVEPPAPTT